MKTMRLWVLAGFAFWLVSGAAVRAQAPVQAIAPDDLVEMKVFQEEDLTTRARVSREGTVLLPLVGVVPVAGRTPIEASEIVRKRLAERYLHNPQVTVSVIEHARKLFTVLGQVQRAGTYRFPDREFLDVVQAVGMAGGFTRIADSTKVTIKRRHEGREKVYVLDLRKMAKSASSPTVAVQPGDIITVAERLF